MNYIIDQILQDLEGGLNDRDVRYFFFGKPETEVSKDVLNKGVVFVQPVDTNIIAVTTGITDEETHGIEIILAKNMQTKVYRNAQQETGVKFLTKVMDGRDGNNVLLADTIRYIIRNHLREYGILQPEINITYDDGKIDIEGAVTATMTITQQDHYNQLI